MVLQYDMYFGLPHIPPTILSILSLHSPASDAYPPKVLLHIFYPSFSWSSLFLSAMKLFNQNIFGHTVSPSTNPPGFDRSDNISMAQEGLDFLVWSQSPFAIQKDGSLDSADRSPMLTLNCRRLNHLRHQLLHGRKLWIINLFWSYGDINFGVLRYVSVPIDRL
jgi:hypothetical protein